MGTLDLESLRAIVHVSRTRVITNAYTKQQFASHPLIILFAPPTWRTTRLAEKYARSRAAWRWMSQGRMRQHREWNRGRQPATKVLHLPRQYQKDVSVRGLFQVAPHPRRLLRSVHTLVGRIKIERRGKARAGGVGNLDGWHNKQDYWTHCSVNSTPKVSRCS